MTETNLNNLIQLVAEFVEERAWTKFHNPKNLAMSIAIESAEIMELFQWLTVEESIEYVSSNEKVKRELSSELSDVIIYCLSMSKVCDIDISKAIRRKLNENKLRFPIEIVSGRLGPYENDKDK
ncbi:MAG: nucleotide pyrophosphohydrolase [Candidatus Hodarchaeales archaeon]|jgi:NTP pyrophosphatase (non-canonical NTP hydrolase)